MAGTRSPGSRIPTRFRGSAADNTIVSPVSGSLRVARNDSTATGKANCSPRNHPQSGRLEFRRDLPAAGKPSAVRATWEDWSRAPANRGRRCRSASAASSRWLRRRDYDRLPGPCTSSAQRPVLCRGRAVAPAALPGAAFGIDQRAQVVETIGRDEPAGDQFPQGSFDLGLEPPGAAHNVGEERRSPLPQEIQHLPRAFAQTARLGLSAGSQDDAASSSRLLRARRT